MTATDSALQRLKPAGPMASADKVGQDHGLAEELGKHS
jgi:hypothetical protein